MTRYALALGLAVTSMLAPCWAFAQTQTLDENINNRGIPRSAPGLSLSNIYGLNPCSTGVSVGVTTPLFGIGGAAANIDRECETRNNAALAITALHDERLAREIMCTIADVREAALRLHEPCIHDGGRIPVAATRVSETSAGEAVAPTEARVPSQYAPAMPMRVPPPAQGPAVNNPSVPAFCRTPGLDRRLYPECVPGSTASRTAFVQEEAIQPAAPQQTRREGQQTRREGMKARAPTVVHPRPTVLAQVASTRLVANRSTSACAVPYALRLVYPECEADVPASAKERTPAHDAGAPVMVASRQP